MVHIVSLTMTNTVEVIFVVVGDIQSNDSKHSVITELPLHCHKLNQLNPFQGISSGNYLNMLYKLLSICLTDCLSTSCCY